MPIAKIQMGAN